MKKYSFAKAGNVHRTVDKMLQSGMNHKNPLLYLIIIIPLLHFLCLCLFHEPAYDSPDAHGYFLQGKILAETGHSRLVEENPIQMIGVHWLETENGDLYSRYPTGLPILIAIVYKLFGPESTLWINIVLSSLSLPLIYGLASRWTSPAMGLVAMLLMAINPIFNQYALNADSHASTLFFLVAGLTAIDKWDRSGATVWAAIGGFLLGYIPLIRYPEALYGLGIIVFLALRLFKAKDEYRGIIAAVFGAAMPLTYMLVRNTLAFGAPWQTAYALTNEQTGFSMDYFSTSYTGYLENLGSTGLGPVFVLGIFGLAGLILAKNSRNWGIMYLVIIVPTTLLYMAYYFGNGNTMTMRFLLPVFPLFIVSACFAVYQLSQHWKISSGWLGAGLIILAALTAVPSSLQQLANKSIGLRTNAHLFHEFKKHIPDSSVVFMGRQPSQYADFAGHWKLADEQLLASSNRMMGINRPILGEDGEDRPSPRQEGRREDVIQRYADLSPEEKMDLVIEDAMNWAGRDQNVYMISDPFSFDRYSRMLHPELEWILVSDIDLDKDIPGNWINSLAERRRNRSMAGPAGPGSRPQAQRMMPMMNQRPNGMGPSRRSPFQTQTTGIISIYKLAERTN